MLILIELGILLLIEIGKQNINKLENVKIT